MPTFINTHRGRMNMDTWKGEMKAMRWNYRMVRINEEWIEVHEVYYDEDGVPIARTENPVGVEGNSPDEIHVCLDLMREALDLPELDDAVFDFSAEHAGGES